MSVVDLFSGCGGMTLGLAEAARRFGYGVDVRLAIDWDCDTARVFEHNFPNVRVIREPVEEFFPARPTRVKSKRELIRATKRVDFLLGGPPCQGHSDLNNRTRRNDDRNELYLVMARAAAQLSPSVVVVENVPAVAHDRSRVVDRTTEHLRRLKYAVHSEIVDLKDLGVPQQRRRHLLVGARSEDLLKRIFDCLRKVAQTRDVAWAIGDLESQANGGPLHVPARTSKENAKRIDWLYDNDAYDLPDRLRPDCHRLKKHSYKSVYGRLRWGEPAPTITTGFSSMGQGRYVHPSQRRTITPREAARIQFLPDFFDFTASSRRSAWSEMIGNAVPPKLTLEVGKVAIPMIVANR